MKRYLYRCVAGAAVWGSGPSIHKAKAAVKSLRPQWPQAEVERIFQFKDGSRRYWQWRNGRWTLWSPASPPSKADLERWA